MRDMKDGGPAFPIDANESSDRCVYVGMTLRDWFAGQALIGLMTDVRFSETPQEISMNAYGLADAMLKAREVQK